MLTSSLCCLAVPVVSSPPWKILDTLMYNALVNVNKSTAHSLIKQNDKTYI